VDERQLIRIQVGAGRCFMNQTTEYEMGEQETVKLLVDQIRSLAAQQDPTASQMSLDLVEGRLDFPSLMVKRGELLGWSLLRVEKGRQQPVNRLGPLNPLQAVVHNPHQEAFLIPKAMPGRRVDLAEVRAIGEKLMAGQDHLLGDSPEQVRSRRLGCPPKLCAVKTSVCQA
jgi:hypothetical protein